MAFSTEDSEVCLNQLLRWLRSPALAVGSRLPGERRLSEQLEASQHLIRVSLDVLAREGYVVRRGRSGTYLIRRPELGRHYISPQSHVPPGRRNRTISCVFASMHLPHEVLAMLQEHALSRDHLIQLYFSGEHGHRGQDERQFLEQAAANAYCGAILHLTPRGPKDEAFLRSLAARMRIAHIGRYALALPEQSFFLPDYRNAGVLAAAALREAGCQELCLISAVPADHHVTVLLRQGMEQVLHLSEATDLGVLDRISPQAREQDRFLEWLQSATSTTGLLVYGQHTPAWIDELLNDWGRPRAKRPTLAVVQGTGREPAPPDAICMGFDWLQRVRDAMDFVMLGDENPVHRLYPAGFQ